MKKINFLLYFLLLVFIVRLSITFLQFYYTPVDGDFTSIVSDNHSYKRLFADPFGLNTIASNEMHSGTNRYFAYKSMNLYFSNIPHFLQNYVTPVNSLYLSCAISKIFVQLIITFLIAIFCFNSQKSKLKFVFLLTFTTILFQNDTLRDAIGVISNSITYNFFYATPIAYLLIYFLPYYLNWFDIKNIFYAIILNVFMIFWGLFISLNGPLLSPVITVFSFLFFIIKVYELLKIKNNTSFFLALYHDFRLKLSFYFHWFYISVLALYSIYLGSYNSDNLWETLPLSEMYRRLPIGFYDIITQNYAYLIIVSFTSLSLFLLKKYNLPEFQKIKYTIYFLGVFSFIYILLLPLGGYRFYRYNIIRVDTFLPVIVCLLFVFLNVVSLTIFTAFKYKTYYFIVFASIVYYFTLNNNLKINYNFDEKPALVNIANCKDSVYVVETGAYVLSWSRFSDTSQSVNNVNLLKKLKIINSNPQYYINK